VTLKFEDFVRKPYIIEAVQISEFNIAEIAPLIGELSKKEDGTPFIQANRELVPYVHRVYPGFWITRMNGQIRCYPRRTFFEQFTPVTEDVADWLETLDVRSDTYEESINK
jgi:hypothetical protein